MSDTSRITRRGLFRGLGTAGLVASCAPRPQPEPPVTPGPVADTTLPGEVLGPGPVPLQFTVNGTVATTEAAPSLTLLEVLRDNLGATGTKSVCNRGACGACTVWVDGVPRPSCMTLAHDVANTQVTTVEGLAQGGKLSPLQQAFVAHDALQCGFCTPGMLMSCQALLARGGLVDAEAVKSAICGNLCRCGTYPNIIAAVLSVAEKGSAA